MNRRALLLGLVATPAAVLPACRSTAAGSVVKETVTKCGDMSLAESITVRLDDEYVRDLIHKINEAVREGAVLRTTNYRE